MMPTTRPLLHTSKGPTIIPVPEGKRVTIETPTGETRTLSDHGNHLFPQGTKIIAVYESTEEGEIVKVFPKAELESLPDSIPESTPDGPSD